MAFFGLPGTDPVSSGQFLGRIQFDARVGFWTLVRRIQTSDGRWDDDKTEPFQKPTFAVDFQGGLEIGYIKFASPPAFVLAPFGGAVPPCPDEMTMPDPKTGKVRKAYQPGFRVKLFAPKLYGSTEPFYFSNTSKSVLEPLDMLHQQYLAAPESKQGKIPVVTSPGNNKIESNSSFGTNTFYSPIFQIVQWIPRPRELGEIGQQAAPAAQTNGSAPRAAAPAAPVASGDDWGTGVVLPAARQGGQVTADMDDEIPF